MNSLADSGANLRGCSVAEVGRRTHPTLMPGMCASRKGFLTRIRGVGRLSG